ncbi:siderophore-interacting protein [Isoptericola sp. NEAU-Y5]|uniref:Siderophore-interacting protein n=1 Tax=Isoptericola luteus TaxID=2879484 RepID=A0ABS7ZIX6_9MICO|nr:siderophore-interacting protein [Isoptericola sp. NEAU-Y5]MCA5893735.1 siderophore-interacting protein [Isoptericola sp. NEAU-Y5]
MSANSFRKPVDPHVLVAEVVTSKQISPSLQRVTLGIEDIDRLTLVGDDQWFRLFLPRPGQESLKLPTRTSNLGWYAQYLATPRARRPLVRNYTVRAARPELREIDVDFVLHGPGGTGHDAGHDAGHEAAHQAGHDAGHAAAEPAGPGATFARTATAGDTVGILDQGAYHRPRPDAAWTLLVADESGLAAVAGICESLPDDAQGVAVVEVPTADDRQDFRVPAGVDLRWVERDRAASSEPVLGEVPGRAALEFARQAELPAGTGYALVAGEQALAAGIRRHLVNDRRWSRANVDFVGYWRHGKASPS